MTAGFGDLYDVPRELQGLFGKVDAVLGITILEHTGWAGDRAVNGHIAVTAPDELLRLQRLQAE